jgi:hypothetical protein
MGKNYTINVKWWGSKGSRQAFGGGNIAKMNNSANQHKETTVINLKGFAGLGLLIRGSQMTNETFGAYTENKLRQRKMQKGITFAKYGIGLALNPALGTLYMASDLGYRSLQYNIGIQKQNREADYYKRLSGNNANSGSRYRGALT